MNRFFLLSLFLSVLFFGCNSDQLPSDIVNNPSTASTKANNNQPIITFDKTEHNFGKILVGEIVSYRFKFTNNGTSDLLITEVKASCGCTTPKYPRKPIAPGKSDYVTVRFNSKGRKGFQSKQISVVTNAQPSMKTLYIKANIVTPNI